MSFVKTKDGVEIFYKDWGKGQPIVFSHGWPLSSDDWDAQLLFFLDRGYRVTRPPDWRSARPLTGVNPSRRACCPGFAPPAAGGRVKLQ